MSLKFFPLGGVLRVHKAGLWKTSAACSRDEGEGEVILELGDRLMKGLSRVLKAVNFHPSAQTSMCIKSKPK